MKAERLPTGDVRLFGDYWEATFPEADRARHIRFYEDMAARYKRECYLESAKELKALGEDSS